MKPEPSLIEALRWWRAAVQAGDGRQFALHLQDEIDKVKDARALYPAAHAIGDRVSVKYPDGLGRQGVVVSVLSFLDGPDQHPATAYGVWLDGESRMNAQTYDSAFVHPAPRTLPLYRAPVVSGGPDWTVEDVVLDPQPAPSWFPMDGRRVTEESPGEAPYKPVTDKARRESIARAVIRSKPGPEGGDCDIDYRAAALVLFNLLDDIDTLDDACREDDAAFRRLAMVKARRREDVGASFDGYTVAFIGEAAYAEGERRASEPSCAEGSPEPLIPDVLSCFDCEGHRVPEGGWLVRHTPTGATGHLPQVDIVRGSAAIGEWVGRFVDAATSPDGVDARFRADPATVAEVEYPANPGERVPVEVADADTDNPKLMFPPEASGRRLIFDDVDGFSVASWLYPDGHREPAGKKPELDAIPKRTGAPKNEYVCLLLGGNPLTRCVLASGHEGACVARDPDDKHTRFVAAIRAEFAATVRDGDVSYMRGRISAFDKAVEIAETIWTGE